MSFFKWNIFVTSSLRHRRQKSFSLYKSYNMPEKREKANWAKSLAFPKPGDELVISGIAGRFPKSDNLTRFQENLLNKEDLISSECRWKSDNPDIPKRIGKVSNIEKFDTQFFGIDSGAANTMDPMGRMLLEHAYEAVIDAGVNPQELRGTKTGVFIGSCYSESENILLYGNDRVNRLGISGCMRGMWAARISKWFEIHGPSYNTDSACSSSLLAFEHAYRAIRSGQCDAALVGGANLCLSPKVSLLFSLLGVLSPDGSCKSFDVDGNGYCRSEAISVVYLQKAKDARRNYATVVHAKTNCDGFKEQGITFPSGETQTTLLRQFYEECRVLPSSLAFMEAHGTGTRAGDPVELNAIEKVFCPGRTTPLLIGSIKSNLGHSEPASGLCSIAKVLIAMESGYIPPNLHYKNPQEGVEALKDGRIQVVTEPTPWNGGYVGVNSFGFGGSNVHVLLKSNPKEKINKGAPDDLPRLVVVSGRTEEAVKTILDHLRSRPVDVEYVSLYHNIHAADIPGHLYRGYTILPPHGSPQNCLRDVQRYPGLKRPVVFVLSGIGTQWAEAGKALSKIPTFAKSIRKCDTALKPYGVNLMNILMEKDPTIFSNIANSFVGIAALQIGLLDVLESIGIVPDYVIGHSVGELGCAYSDGCLTAEQMVLAAYFQGLALMESQMMAGSMATVRLGDVELKGMCPPDIQIACHNAPKSSTISGPADAIKQFVAKLQSDGILASEESCSNIACHSLYIRAARSKLLAYLRKVIPHPKARSKKWLSTSVPQNKWNSTLAQLCSPEYYTNNLLSPVLFREAFSLIPNNAIVIEVAPHGFQQGILIESSNSHVTNIPLINHERKDHVLVLLEAIGKIYEVGLHPQLTRFFPKVEHPVSRRTPMISPLVQWEHSDDWQVVDYRTKEIVESGVTVVEIKISDEEFEWMAGHVIDGRNLVPATGYLAIVWETVGLMEGKVFDDVSVVFEDIRFHRATTIPKQGSVELTIMVQKGSNRFEVSEGGAAVVTGFVQAVTNPAKDCVGNDMLTHSSDESLDLTDRDIYKELRLRGYHYAGLFRSLKRASTNGAKGRIAWKRNWGAFMDNMLQMKILGIDTRGLFVPTGIQKLVIDAKVHQDQIYAMADDDKEFTVEVYKDFDLIVSGGIEIRGLKASAIARRKPAGDPVLEDFKFIAHRDNLEMELLAVTRIATHIALENNYRTKIKTIELIGSAGAVSSEDLTSPIIEDVLNDLPLLQADVKIFAPIHTFADNAIPSSIKVLEPKNLAAESDALLVISHGLFTSKNIEIVKQLRTTITDAGFLLAREPANADNDILTTVKSEGFDIILEKRTSKESIILLRKTSKLSEITTVIQINNYEFTWLSALQAALQAENNKECRTKSRILLVSEGDFESGLMGLVNCLRREPGGDSIQGLLIQDPNAPKFSLENPLYSEQLKLGLALNVLRPSKMWGSYRFSVLNPYALKPIHHVQISQLTRGDLSSLVWTCGRIQPDHRSKDIIEVHYSSLNFRDVMISTGKLGVEVVAKTRKAEENVIGFEFSGRDVNGRAVMGMVGTGAVSNLCISDSELLWSVPDNWTLEDAATVPVVYGTVYYALMINGEMKKGDKVLIHAGSGGVGQAAITLALYEGCEVFTTVGTPQKREFIKKQFPQIDDDHIGNSRDTSFEQLILRKTQGRGVDIVLNSLAEEKLQASVRCLAKGGRFLEIGKFDMAANNLLGMEVFVKGIRFHGILVDNLFSITSEKKNRLVALLTEGLKSGAVKPLVRTVFPMDQAEVAFRHMAAGMHIGKVILKIRDENEAQQPTVFRGLPRYYCLEDSSYLILGGLGGFGLELADWLVLRGATKLVLTSRKGIVTGYQRLRMSIWKSYGVEIVIIVGKDASTHEGCEFILKQARALGPVDAIFNLAVVLKDSLCENQTVESFEESFRVKAWATKQLDKLSRTLCPHLRQFVVFSSVSCGRGNPGQTNYGMANSIMERICETRAAENLPALAVQWGAIGDVGLVAEMQEDDKEVVIGGTLQQKILSCLHVLDGFLQQNSPIVSSMVVAEKIAGGAGTTNVIDTVVNLMGLKTLQNISWHTPLSDLGMDSMMAVEIKQTLEREFEIFLTAQDIRGLNFLKLQEMSLKQLGQDENSHDDNVKNEESDNGIKLLIRTLGTDQTNKNICISLATGVEDKEGEIFILPGIEGSHNVLQPLACKLKFPTTCLQLGTTCMGLTSIEEMADYLIPHVKARSKGLRDFVMVGYSFGSLIAIELVRRLELEGLSGSLLLIDGSPEYMKAMITEHLFANTDDELQSNLLLGVMDILKPSAIRELAIELQNCDTWEEKLAAFTKDLSEDNVLNYTREDQQAMCTAVYSRMKAAQIYDPSALPPLRTPIILLKPKIRAVRLIPEDYGLGLLTRAKVNIHYVEGDHATMLEDDLCAAAINGELVEDVTS